MTLGWDPERAASFYDEYGEQEWTRFEDGRTPAPSLDVHLDRLRRFVGAGDRVLEVGAGPGRFTIELARLGAQVSVSDLSPGQLELNRKRVAAEGLEEHVVERELADVLDLSRWDDASFDATVCFGGPLSYVVDRADEGIAELVRVTRPGGHVLVSVMSLVGTVTHYLPILLDLVRRDGVDKNEAIVRTGFLPDEPDYGHLAMKLFRWSELEALLVAARDGRRRLRGRPASRRPARGAGAARVPLARRARAGRRARCGLVRPAHPRRAAARAVKSLAIYLMCGPETPALAQAAVEGGADLVELGFPFSDPLADGPVIRRAAERALAQGMRTGACLEVLAATRELLPETPLVPMTYSSLLEAHGWERFAADAQAAGATSMIVADLPAGERPELRRVQLVAPTSTDERLALAAAQSDGWLYLVTLTGTTGARSELSPALAGLVARARAQTELPLYAGFGISTPEHARAAAELADGVVVGSRAVEVAEDGPAALRDYVSSLRVALDA